MRLLLIQALLCVCLGQTTQDTTTSTETNNTSALGMDMTQSQCMSQNRYVRLAGIPFPREWIYEPSKRNTRKVLDRALQYIGDRPEENFETNILNMHNAYRDILGLQRLVWDDGLRRTAQSWSNRLLSENRRLRHSTEEQRGATGENLYWNSQLLGKNIAKIGMRAFFQEYSLYNGERIGQGNFHGYGHFTALAWPQTQRVGCSLAQSNGRGTYLTCHYFPAGNKANERLLVQAARTRLV